MEDRKPPLDVQPVTVLMRRRHPSLQYWPLAIVVAFNLITLGVFLIAPFQWQTDNLLGITVLIIVSQLSIVIGFSLGYRASAFSIPSAKIFHQISDKWQNFIFIFCIATIPLKYAYLTGISPFDITEIIDFLMRGIRNPHEGYSLAINPTNVTTIRWCVFFFISIINQVFFIIGFLCWKDYHRIKKCLFMAILAVELFYFMGTARNFGIIYLITTFAFTQLHRVKAAQLRLSRALKYSVVLFILLATSIAIFSYNMHGRSNVAELDLTQFNLGITQVDLDSSVFSILPPSLHTTYVYVASYLAQGYYHTSLAFDLDFRWTYFAGNNPALINLIDILGVHVWENTYVYRLSSMGVDPFGNWHSSYCWFASDVSFFGVPFLLLILGYVFGFSWRLGSKHNDFLSKIVFVIVANMLLFLFANNSYLSTVFYSVMFILPIWCWTRLPLASSRGCSC